MDKVKTVMDQRPHYFHGQLLLKDDFLLEQKYHIDARRRHNRSFYGWGVVQGLKVARYDAHAVNVEPGYAIDEFGREISLNSPQRIEVTNATPNQRVKVLLAYEEDVIAEGEKTNRRKSYATVIIAGSSETVAGVTLAMVQLDDSAAVKEDGVDYSQTKYAKIVAPESITAAELHPNLRKGWLRMPFRPDPMIDGPEEGDISGRDGLLAFRIGATEALSPDPKEAAEKDRGAAGTMAIPVPPNIRHVTQLRIAGSENAGGLLVRLIVGGWDLNQNKHFRKTLVDQRVTTTGPYLATFPIKETALDPEYHTLALWLRGLRRTAVSLVAVEFAY